ncbi:unnamed protein product [Schistosoma rodhaini]|uniref:Chorein N-terminal domain-containing protein n=1 Tax=Schistosoma rodhaini TaxID=6188 RepID=A0AA85G768_9TREM|nr:unnamed protein product [Schistosoma rodhaini]CAH8605819.1 unnamed protein product [Schistosoma rodhaini]
MFKKFLAAIIDHIIGRYFEDFNGENLSYGLLNGNITLSNLTLRKDTLNSLFGIPLTLKSGSVGNVSIFIPYTHLWSQAWQLSLDKVDLVAYASAEDLWVNLNPNHSDGSVKMSSINESRSENWATKTIPKDQGNKCFAESPVNRKYSLDQMEKRWYQTISGGKLKDAAAMASLVAMDSRSDNSSWWSYITSVGYSIIRSLQIEIREVRISLIDPNTFENQDSLSNSSCDYRPNFGTFTISLQRLTLETTNSLWQRTSSTSQEPVEYKLIDVDGLSTTWSPKLSVPGNLSAVKIMTESSNDCNKLLKENLLYILPPCHLTGHLKRNQTNIGIVGSSSASITPTSTSNHPLELNNKAQIELNINLSQLNIQISQKFCCNLLYLSKIFISQYERLEQLKRRPSNVVKNGQWWRYLAGEIRPKLRVLFHSTLSHISLSDLAVEAKLNVIYVKAYTAHLIQGLSSSTTKCLITTDQINGICNGLGYTSEMHLERLKLDQLWSIQRIATLRLIAMRRAAVTLLKLLKSDNKSSTITIDPGIHPSTAIESSSTANQSWYYTWWRYSSGWGIHSLLSSLTSSTTVDELQSNVDRLNQPVTEQQTIDSDLNHSMNDTIFELLDEFASHTNNIDYTGVTYPIFVQLVCTVDGCSLRLIDHLEESVETYTHPAFISISGKQLYFDLEVRPQCYSYRLSTHIQSFTVHDERYMLKNCKQTSSQCIPMFPVVVFPRYQTSSLSTNKQSNEKQVFSLIYELNPSQKNVDYVLQIHTEPVNLVFQPELIHHIMNFVYVITSASSSQLETSTGHRYTLIKERTIRNLHSFLKSTPDKNVEVKINSSKLPQFFPSNVSTPVKSHNRWAINFNIDGLKVLFPNRFMHDSILNPNTNLTSNSIICVLCDFGHLQVTNWPEIQLTNKIDDRVSVKMSSLNCRELEIDNHQYKKMPKTLQSLDVDNDDNNGDDEDDDDNDEQYKTPCSTPAELSEIEEGEVGQSMKHEVEKASQRQTETVVNDKNRSSEKLSLIDNNNNIYVSYTINVTNIRVLVGCLDLFNKLDLWNCYNLEGENLIEPKSAGHTLPFGNNNTFSFDDQSVLRVSNSTMISRLCLINPFSLRILISRRVCCIKDLTHTISAGSSSSSSSINYPPYLWITIKHESCVVHLSNTKISNLLSCLNASQCQLNRIKPIKWKYSSIMKKFNRARNHSISFTDSNVHSNCNTFKHRSHHTSISVSQCHCHRRRNCCSEKSADDSSSLKIFNFKRKKLIVTYSIQSFIIQFESKDRPLAECRLDGAVCSLSVYHGSPVPYCLQFKLKRISMVDAISNLGGVYDVIVNSDEKFESTNSPDLITRLNDQANNDSNISSSHICNVLSVNSTLSIIGCIPLLDHICPEEVFNVKESYDFITGTLSWCPLTDCLSHNEVIHSIGTYFIQLNINCFNIIGNPITVKSIHDFLNDLYCSTMFNQSVSSMECCTIVSELNSHRISLMNKWNDDSNNNALSLIKYEFKLSINNIKLLLINQFDVKYQENNVNVSVKRIAEIVLSGLHMNFHHSSLSNSVLLKLQCFQIIPYCNSKLSTDQYLLGPALSLSTSDHHHSDPIILKYDYELIGSSNYFPRKTNKHLQISLSNIVYIHFIHELHEILVWFKQILPLLCNQSSITNNDQLSIDNIDLLFNYPELSITFNNPLILIPCKSNQSNQFLLFGVKLIKINHHSSYCEASLSNPSVTRKQHERMNKSYSMQLYFIDFGVFLYTNNDNVKKSSEQYLSSSSSSTIYSDSWLNFSSLYKFWLDSCKLDDIMLTATTEKSRHHIIISPINFSAHITYVKSNFSKYFSTFNSRFQSIRFNFSDFVMMHSVTMSHTTDDNNITEDYSTKRNSPSSYRLSSTSPASNMNLLLFTEPINAQLIIEFYIQTVYINLTKMNCNLLTNVIQELCKEYCDYCCNKRSPSNIESSHSNQTELFQLPYSDSNILVPSIKSTTTPSMEFGLFINCIKLNILIYGDLDIIPIPLVLLTLDYLFITSSIHLLYNGIKMPSCIQLNLNNIQLINQLEKRFNYKPPPPPPQQQQQNTTSSKFNVHYLKQKPFSSNPKSILLKFNNENNKIQFKLNNDCLNMIVQYRKHYLSYATVPATAGASDDDNSVCELNQRSPISLRIILLSDEHQTFCQTKSFVKFTCNTIDLQLYCEPWILILDFFNLCDYKEETTQHTSERSRQDLFHESNSCTPISPWNNPKIAVLLDIDSLHCFVSNSDQEKDNEKECRNCSHLISNEIESNIALLSLIRTKAQINYFITDYEMFSSLNLPVNYSYLEIKGQICDVKLQTIQEKHYNLYPTRFTTMAQLCRPINIINDNDNSQSCITFQLIKPAKHFHQRLTNPTVSADDEQDMYISIQLPAVTYIHTQSFLTSVIDSLFNFKEHYDFVRQTRAAVKGFQIPTISSVSSRIRINVSGGPLNLIIPVSSYSSQVLIAKINQLKINNKFLWNTNQENVHCESVLKSNEKCYNRYFFSNMRSLNKSGLLGLLECSNLNSEDLGDSQSLLIDRINMELNGFSLYCAEQTSLFDPDLTRKSDPNYNNSYIHLPNQLFIPIGRVYPSHSNHNTFFINPTDCVNLILEHNLTSGKIPDWKLSGEFTNSQLQIDQHIYCLIRGILSHNFGEYSKPSVDTTKPLHESNIWPKFAIEIRMNSVQATLFASSSSLVAVNYNSIVTTNIKGNDFFNNNNVSNPFAIIDFCDTLLTYEYFSNRSTSIQLQCYDINLLKTQIDKDDEQNQFILKSLSTDSSDQLIEEVEERVKQTDKILMKTPKLFICSNSSLLQSTLIFSLMKLHLNCDWDWLLRFQYFLLSSPLPSGSENSPIVYTLQKPISPYMDCISTTRTISKSQMYSDGSSYNHRQESNLSSGVLYTSVHVFIEDCEAYIPYEKSCFLIKSSIRFSRHTSKYSISEIINDELHTDILQFCLYSNSKSLLIIPSPLKFYSKLYHHLLNNKSSSSSQLFGLSTSTISSMKGTLMNTGLLWSPNVFIEYPPWQRNLLHVQPAQLQLQMSLTAPNIHITSNYSELQNAIQLFSSLMMTNASDSISSSSVNAHSNNARKNREAMHLLPDIQLPNQKSSSLLATFWPTVFANYISKQLIHFDIKIAFSICLFDTISSVQSSLSAEEIPLIKFCVENMKLFWKRLNLQATLECTGISSSYYNQNLIAWEPALEPWSCLLNWTEKCEQDFSRTISLNCSSQCSLKLNLTVPLVQIIRRLLNTWIKTQQSPQYDTIPIVNQQDLSFLNSQNTGSFVLINQTGTNLRYKLINNHRLDSLFRPEVLIPDKLNNSDDDNSDEVGPDSRVYLPIKISSFAYNLSTNTQKINTNVDSIQLPSLSVQINGWKPIYPISLDRLGTYYRVIERLNNAEPEILKNEQNECWKYHLPIFNRLIIDIVHDQNSHYSIYLRSGLTITNDLNQSINIGLEITSTKSSSFSAFELHKTSESVISSSDAYLKNAFYESVLLLTVCKPKCTYPVPINIVGLMSLGLGNLCFSPTKTVMNRRNLSSLSMNNTNEQNNFTDNLYDWANVYHHNNEIMTEEEQVQSAYSSLTPTSTVSSLSSSLTDFVDKRRSSSVRMVNWTNLKQSDELLEAILISTYQLPSNSRTIHQISSLQRFQQTNTTPSTTIPSSLNKTSLSGINNNNNKFHICVTVVRDRFPLDPQWNKFYSDQWYMSYKHLLPITLPGHHITIGPVLRITNLLPCDMIFFIFETDINGTLGSKEEACVHNLFPVNTIKFGIHLDGFRKCDPLSIPSNTYNQKVLIRLYDTLGRPLELQVHVCSRAFGARHLTVSPVICLLNKSGIPLMFAQSSSSLSSNQLNLSSQTSILAAGQIEEHEQACALMPLLFSFANKFEGYLLRVRIGKGYHSENDVLPNNENDQFLTSNIKRCTWSPGISLDKCGVDVLQLKVYTENNRLSSVRYLGFEVDTGHHPNDSSLSTTTMVTFRPRYIIENLTKYPLNITQRYCLKTTNNLPASIIVHPNRSQSFHWSNDDLDRLLCMRAAIGTSLSSNVHDQMTTGINNPSYDLWTMWSGGFQIDHAHSFIIMLRLNHFHQIVDFPQSLFFHVIITLQSATFIVQIQHYHGLPPFRFENLSSICVYYCQFIDSSNSDKHIHDHYIHQGVLHHSISSIDNDNDESINNNNNNVNEVNKQILDKWDGGACPSFLIPGSIIPYALEEPCGSSSIIFSVQDDISEIVNLDTMDVSKILRYDNFVYLTLFGPLMDYIVPTEMKANSYSLRRRSSSLPNLVFDILPGSNYVVCATKSSRRHSQLWKLSDDGLIYHENTSLSTPGSSKFSRKSSKNKYQFVLDINRKGDPNVPSNNDRSVSMNGLIDPETLKHFEVVQLIIAKPSKQRKAYQTWRIDQNGLLVNSALFCVQIRRDLMDVMSSSQLSLDNSFEESNNDDSLNLPHNISSNQLILLAARPRPLATRLISSSITSAIILPIWLRPGSGRLRLFTYLDKATRVLRIEDEDINKTELTTQNTDNIKTISRWGKRTSSITSPGDLYSQCESSVWEDSSYQSNLCGSVKTRDHHRLVTNFKASLTLPNGIGINVISSFMEELIYVSLSDINLLLTRTYSDILTTNTTPTTSDLVSSSENSIYMMKHANSCCNILNDNCLSSITHHGLNSINLGYPPVISRSSLNNDDTSYNNNLAYRNENESCLTKVSETFQLLIGHFQIDSQFTGALFPVLLFQINTKLIANDQDHLNVDTDHEKLKMNLFPNYSITTTSTTEFTQTQSNYCTMNEMKHLSKLKITYSRDNIQNNWPIHLFKIFQIDISPLNVQAEELLLLKLIQFYQHAFEEDTDTDERNNSYNHHLHSSHSSHNYDDNDPSVLSDSFKIPLAHNSDKRKHSMLHNTKSENKIFWCDRFIISPIHMKLSVQTAKSSLTESYLAGAKRLLPSLMSFTGAEIQLDPIEKLYMLESIPQLINYLNTYYRLQLRAHALNIFGSVDFLGNPIGLINDLSSGISGLVELDVGGLIRHVAHGVGDSAAKVAGSVSQLLTAISLDDKHEQERAAILGSRIDSSSLLQTSQSIFNSNYYDDNEVSYSGIDESLDDFELTCHDTYTDVKSTPSTYSSSSPLSSPSSTPSTITSLSQYSNQTHHSFDTNRSVTAPLSAGVRGLMHGIVGGMTSIVTQPYRGAKEDQLRGFVYGVGRGLLGTVTKPVGGVFDFLSGMMSSISEVARPANLYRPKRCRPRRSGLSKYFSHPLIIYNLDEAIAQLQIHHLTLFNVTRRYSLKNYYSSSLNIFNSIVKSLNTYEIGEEGPIDTTTNTTSSSTSTTVTTSTTAPSSSSSSSSSTTTTTSSSNNNNVNESDPTTKLSPINSYKLTDLDLTYSFSRMLCIYTLLPCNNGPEALASHHLRYLIYSPESILHILPIQLNGVVVLITDQAIWCIRDNSLQNWITSKYPVGNHNINMSDSNSSVASHQTPPVFFLTENTTLMFMLHYHRLDQIYVMLSSNTNTLSSVSTSTINSTTTITSTTNPPTTNPPVYVVFSADCGTSKQQLRCDYLTWGLDLTLLVRNAQFRFAQANMRVNRLMNISTNTTSSSSLSTGSSKNNKQQLTTACYNVPRFQNHPVALAYSPICHK